MRLAATRRVEDGAVQGHPSTLGIDIEDRCIKVTQVGIPQEELVGRHSPILPGA
jgi:hypothetical protein